MSYYPSDFIEQLRLNSDLVSLISEDTVLKGKGHRYMGLCPFPDHAEKTPSFSVSAGEQLYYCFGCRSGGNIFTYLEKQRGMSFKEAVEYLANKKGMELPKQKTYSPSTQNKYRPSADDFVLTEKICSFFENQLEKTSADHPARTYLKKREWPKETIKNFRLGYAPKNNTLLSFLKNPEEQKKAKQLGLLNHSYEQNRPYDNFRNRLIFPIVSIKKQVVGFGARVLDDSLPKYINSKESNIFHKGEIFYGLNESARYLRQDSSALIVEGYSDFLSLWKAGFKNVVATLGTALTEKHASVLKRYVDNAVLVFDGDTAGLKASERSLPLLLGAGLKVKILSLPKGQDPDDLIRLKGPDEFQKRFELAEDLFFFILKYKHSQNKDNLYLMEETAPLIAKVQNKALKAIYTQRLLDLFGSDARVLQKTLEEKIKTAHKPSYVSTKKEPSTLDVKTSVSLAQALQSERILLALCLQSEKCLKQFLEKNSFSHLKTQEIIKVFNLIADTYKKKPSHFNQLIHIAMNLVLETHYLFKSFYPVFNSKDLDEESLFKDCLNDLKKRQSQSQVNQLVAEMKMNPKEDLKGLEKVFQLTKQRLN